jgi:hypothetical protein
MPKREKKSRKHATNPRRNETLPPLPSPLERPDDGRPILRTSQRWASGFEALVERLALPMLRSEEQRVVAIFELEGSHEGRFAQYLIEPQGLLLDLPATCFDSGQRERLLASHLGLRRAAEVPELCGPEEEILEWDPLRKAYRWDETEKLGEDLEWLLFGFWGMPPPGPVALAWWAEGGEPRQELVLVRNLPRPPVVVH